MAALAGYWERRQSVRGYMRKLFKTVKLFFFTVVRVKRQYTTTRMPQTIYGTEMGKSNLNNLKSTRELGFTFTFASFYFLKL